MIFDNGALAAPRAALHGQRLLLSGLQAACVAMTMWAVLRATTAEAKSATTVDNARAVGSLEDSIAAFSLDDEAVVLSQVSDQRGKEVRVVDLRHGRVGANRSVSREALLLLAAEGSTLVVVDPLRRKAERITSFAGGAPLQTLRLPAGVRAAAIDHGAGALFVVAPPEAGRARGGKGQGRPAKPALDEGLRLCLYRLSFAPAQGATAGAEPVRCVAFAPAADGFELDTPHLTIGKGAGQIWWLQPSHWMAGCGGGGEDVRLLLLDAATLSVHADLATAAESEGSQPLDLPACAADPVVELGVQSAMRLDTEDGGVSFLTRVQGSEMAAALWTVALRSAADPTAGAAIGVQCLGVGRGQHAVGTPGRTLAGIASALIALDAVNATAVAGPISAADSHWLVATDAKHAAQHAGSVIVAFDVDGPVGVVEAKELLAATAQRLIYRDRTGMLHATAWDELGAIPVPSAGLDAVFGLIAAAMRLLGC